MVFWLLLNVNLIQAKTMNENQKMLQNERISRSKKIVYSLGFTAGAFSQQYFKYLKTRPAWFIFSESNEYEYSVLRYNYYLPTAGISKIYSTTEYKNIDVGIDFQPCIAKSVLGAKFIGIVTPHFILNKKYFGIGAGISFGNRLFNDEVFAGGLHKFPRTTYSKIRILPELRIGQLDVFYFELTRLKPVTLDAIEFFYGIGTGFGKLNQYALRLGLSIKYETNGKYCEIKIPVNNHSFLNIYGGYSKNVIRKVSISPNESSYNEINTNTWFTGFKMNWNL